MAQQEQQKITMTMTGNELYLLRTIRLANALGRRVSQHDLGVALGLQPASAARRVRKWEDGEEEISGTTEIALAWLWVSIPDFLVPSNNAEALESFNKFWRWRFDRHEQAHETT
jgi:hypothetical protein